MSAGIWRIMIRNAGFAISSARACLGAAASPSITVDARMMRFAKLGAAASASRATRASNSSATICAALGA